METQKVILSGNSPKIWFVGSEEVYDNFILGLQKTDEKNICLINGKISSPLNIRNTFFNQKINKNDLDVIQKYGDIDLTIGDTFGFTESLYCMLCKNIETSNLFITCLTGVDKKGIFILLQLALKINQFRDNEKKFVFVQKNTTSKIYESTIFHFEEMDFENFIDHFDSQGVPNTGNVPK